METAQMGKTVVAAKIQNESDLVGVIEGRLRPDQVRSVDVEDALVDTGATGLSLPQRLIQQLGLQFRRTRRAKTAAGNIEFRIYSSVQLTVQGRECAIEVSELPDTGHVLIGQVPLEMLDWVVDPGRQRLIGNPDHGGEQMMEVYSHFPE